VPRPADTSIAISAPIDAAHGANPKEPQTLLEVPEANTLQHLLEICHEVINPTAPVERQADDSASQDGPAAEPPPDEGASSANHCPLEPGAYEPEPPPPPLECTEDAGFVLMPAQHGNAERCPADQDTPIECRDVCGTLDMCSEGEVTCDQCLARCVESGPSPTDGSPCLSRAVYLIDEEGCGRMLDVYANFDASVDCE